MPRVPHKPSEFVYDVTLSFSGRDRPYVAQVADALEELGLRVFYDEYEQVTLWGKDLYEHLAWVYSEAARFCVMFVSQHYAESLWTTHERRNAQERAFLAHDEYILPVRFDDTDIPGLRTTVGFLDLYEITPTQLADLIRDKVGVERRFNYLPPNPDQLYGAMGATTPDEERLTRGRASQLLDSLSRTDRPERELLYALAMNGCGCELPANFHANIDLMRRDLRWPASEIKAIAGRMRSLGILMKVRSASADELETDELGVTDVEYLSVEFFNRTPGEFYGDVSELAYWMIRGNHVGLCPDCAFDAAMRLDFGQLSKVTARRETDHDADPFDLPTGSN